MLALIWKLLVGSFDFAPRCAHEWEDKRRIKVYGNDLFGYETDNPTSFEIECRCKKCGAWKTFKL